MTPLFCYCLQVNEVIIHVIYWFILLACCNRGRGRRNRLSDVIYSNGQNWMLNFNDSCLSHFHFLLENLVHHCFLLISIIYVRNCRLLLNIILELISWKKMSIKMGSTFQLTSQKYAMYIQWISGLHLNEVIWKSLLYFVCRWWLTCTFQVLIFNVPSDCLTLVQTGFRW